MKNCEPFVLGPELAIEIMPAPNTTVRPKIYKMMVSVNYTAKKKKIKVNLL